jgi:hypothetical protein
MDFPAGANQHAISRARLRADIVSDVSRGQVAGRLERIRSSTARRRPWRFGHAGAKHQTLKTRNTARCLSAAFVPTKLAILLDAVMLRRPALRFCGVQRVLPELAHDCPFR